MRALLLATALLATCSSGVRAPAGQASKRDLRPEAAAPRVLASAERDCTVSWSHDYRSLDLMADAADLIVRAQVVGQEIVQLRAFGANGQVSLRDARRTTGSARHGSPDPSSGSSTSSASTAARRPASCSPTSERSVRSISDRHGRCSSVRDGLSWREATSTTSGSLRTSRSRPASGIFPSTSSQMPRVAPVTIWRPSRAGRSVRSATSSSSTDRRPRSSTAPPSCTLRVRSSAPGSRSATTSETARSTR